MELLTKSFNKVIIATCLKLCYNLTINNHLNNHQMETQNKNQKQGFTPTPNFGVSSAKAERGFTLIELLVVIAIIALLASVVLVGLNSARQKARDSRRVGDINQIAKALELFFNNSFSYPTTAAAGVALNTYGPITGSNTACANSDFGCVNNLIPNFIVKVPVAPTPADSSSAFDCSMGYGNDGGTANDYQYGGTGGATTIANYTITFCIGSLVGALPAGMHTLTQGGIR